VGKKKKKRQGENKYRQFEMGYYPVRLLESSITNFFFYNKKKKKKKGTNMEA
jgi:hypothetical protein